MNERVDASAGGSDHASLRGTRQGMRSDLQCELIGPSAQMSELRQEIERIAPSDAKVLITGESGVGKEIVANAIHARSGRNGRTFVPVNCAGLPETLLESELFGHVKGSFTGAYRDKPGKLEIADNGTVFLDEIGEMTLRMQGILLRFLESGELQKVGTDRPSRTVNVRVIGATNRSLREMIADGRFREDLFYRLNVIHLWIPPLRERKDDIAPMIDHFLRIFTRKGYSARKFAPEAQKAMLDYTWPGNVRELENAVEQLMVRTQTEVIRFEDLPEELRSKGHASVQPRRERRRTMADDLYKRLTEDQQSFWAAVYPLYIQREITRDTVREVVRRGLEQARGNYRIVAKLFNMEPQDYKRFLNFLRKHNCQLPFSDFR
jgi:transcriptional regulator with PAS, ATPase and Fis domain